MENEVVALKIKGYAGLTGYIVDKKQRVLKSEFGTRNFATLVVKQQSKLWPTCKF